MAIRETSPMGYIHTWAKIILQDDTEESIHIYGQKRIANQLVEEIGIHIASYNQ